MKKVLIKTREKSYILYESDILYCKASGAYSIMYLKDGRNVVTSMNLLKLSSNIERFSAIYRVGRSYLVNINYVMSINHAKKNLELYSDVIVPYSIPFKELEEIFDNIVHK